MRLTRLAALTTGSALLLGIASPALAAPGDPGALTYRVSDDSGSPDGSKAWVRVLHASPDAPSVDVFVNGSKVAALSGATFGQLTAYLQVDATPGPEAYDIDVCATADNTVCPIENAVFDPQPNKKYTIAASDALASIDVNIFEDGMTPKKDNASVRVIHLSADTPAVDVLTQDGVTAVVDNLAYPDATDYLDLPAGSYDLKVCANADNSVCPLDLPALALTAGQEVTVWAIGSLAIWAQQPTPTATPGAPTANPTPPHTDTLAASETTGSASPVALVLVAIALAVVSIGAQLVPSRIRNRR